MAFRHVVLLAFTDEATPEQRRAVLDGLAALPSQIPEIRSYVFGPDAGVGDGNHDVALVADFDDADGFRTYVAHPTHQALLHERIKPILRNRTAVQYVTS